jgi:hypothetical protein
MVRLDLARGVDLLGGHEDDGTQAAGATAVHRERDGGRRPGVRQLDDRVDVIGPKAKSKVSTRPPRSETIFWMAARRALPPAARTAFEPLRGVVADERGSGAWRLVSRLPCAGVFPPVRPSNNDSRSGA